MPVHLPNRTILTLREVLAFLFKGSKVIITVTAVAVLVTAAITMSKPDTYVAETKLLYQMGGEKFSSLETFANKNYSVFFQERNQNINNELEIFRGMGLTDEFFGRLRRKLEEIQRKREENRAPLERFKEALVSAARSLLARIRGKEEEKDEEKTVDATILRRIFMDSVDIRLLADTDVFAISFFWNDAEFAAFAANTFTDAFLDRRYEIYLNKQETFRFYREQKDISEKKYNRVARQLLEIKLKNDISDIDTERRLLLESRDRNRLAFQNASRKYNEISIIRAEIERMAADPDSWVETPTMIEEYIDKQDYLKELDRSYFTLRGELDREHFYLTPRHKRIQTIRYQIEQLKLRKARSLLNILDTRLKSIAAVRESLRKDIAAENDRLQVLNRTATLIEDVERQKEALRSAVVLYAEKSESLRVYDSLGQRQLNSVHVIQRATPPLFPAGPNRKLAVAIAFVFGIFSSFGFLLVQAYFDHRFKEESDVDDILEVPLLLTVIRRKKKRFQWAHAGTAPPRGAAPGRPETRRS